MIHDGRHAAVGAAQQPAAILQRPGAGDLKMLQRADAGPEPGVVGNGQQQIRPGRGAAHQAAVGHLVADRQGGLPGPGIQGRLLPRAGREGRHGQIEKVNQSPQLAFPGQIVAERRQPALGVASPALAQRQSAVVEQQARIRRRLHGGDAQHQGAALPLAPLVQLPEQAFRLMLVEGDGRFRPDDQVPPPVRFGQSQMQRDDGLTIFRQPLLRLIHIALHQGDGSRRAGADPIHSGEGRAGQPRRCRQRQGSPGARLGRPFSGRFSD